mmetsp:Transcript_3117/g.7421  ORF Transcript_3117/g.7421 Transcript_3117/m.7421 type:complete len:356 (-) Transcript_3117:9-1076(-)
MRLDMRGLDVDPSLVLLVHSLGDGRHELVCNEVDVGTALGGVDTIYKRNLLERAIRNTYRHIPSWSTRLANLHRPVLLLQIQINIVTEITHLQLAPVEKHFTLLVRRPRHIEHTLGHQVHHVLREPLHAELGEVRPEGDASVIRPGRLGDLRLAPGLHVALKHLHEFVPALAVGSLEDELAGEDVGELRSVAVSAAGDLLLLIVVVVRGQEVAKNQLGHVDIVLFVDLHRDTRSVVPHPHASSLLININLDSVHALVPLVVVRRVHQDLVKNLEQRRHPVDLPLLHLTLLAAPHPQCVGGGLHRPDVGIGTKEDVLNLVQLLVGLLHRLPTTGLSWRSLLRGHGGGAGRQWTHTR